MSENGYIVVAINFVGGGKAVYRVRWQWHAEPTNKQMREQVTDHENGSPNTLYFLGAPLSDALQSEEEFWMQVPPTGYTSASWRHYAYEELRIFKNGMEQKQPDSTGSVIPR